MTGFYVANVVSRYWDQFLSLPMPDKLAYKLVAYIQGQVIQRKLQKNTKKACPQQNIKSGLTGSSL